MPPPPGFGGDIWIYDFKEESKKAIDTKGIAAKDLIWSKHDSNIYIYNGKEYLKYDPLAMSGEIVNINGLYFSPDGRYYCSGDYGTARSRIYRVSDNLPAKEINEKIDNLKLKRLSFESWALQGGAILYKTGKNKYSVIDLKKGEVNDSFEGRLIGGDNSGSRFIFNPVIAEEKGKPRIDVQSIEFIELQSSDNN